MTTSRKTSATKKTSAKKTTTRTGTKSTATKKFGTTATKKFATKRLTTGASTKKKVTTALKSKKVLPIPEGYTSITPYLIVSNATKAIEFYKNVFGAKKISRMESPTGKIMHAELMIGDTKIMLADEFPEMGARGPKAYGGSPISIHLYVKNVDAVIKKALSSGAKLKKPIEDRFYGDRSGGIEDPFGHQWYVSTHIEDVSMHELKKRAAEMFGQGC